jgi:membrane protein
MGIADPRIISRGRAAPQDVKCPLWYDGSIPMSIADSNSADATSVSDSATIAEAPPRTLFQSPGAANKREPLVGFERQSTLAAMRRRALPTLKYLTQTEVHTFAFSVAANAILSFFPFMLLLMTISRRVLHSRAMYDVIQQLLRTYLPAGQDFIVRNLHVLVSDRHGVQVMSLAILLFTSTGVFEPLEVALNHAWGIKKNRSYVANQLISLALAFACGTLALASIALTAGNQVFVGHVLGGNFISYKVDWLIMKIFAITASISIYFLIYWLLPNGKVKARWVLPAAIVAGVLQEIAKYAYLHALPVLNFADVYGPFSISVTLMFWAFISGLLLLGGAYLSAAGKVDQEREQEETLAGAGTS